MASPVGLVGYEPINLWYLQPAGAEEVRLKASVWKERCMSQGRKGVGTGRETVREAGRLPALDGAGAAVHSHAESMNIHPNVLFLGK